MRILSNIHMPVEEPFISKTFTDYLPDLPHKVFNSHGLKYTSLKNLLDKIPADEYPDVMAIASPEYLPVPEDIDQFEGAKALLITDWNVCTRFLGDLCPLFDFCFTDEAGVRTLRSWGLKNVYHQPLFGHAPSVFRLLKPEESYEEFLERPYDVSFCGSLNTGLHFKRNQFLHQLSQLADRFNVYIGQDHNENYIKVLNNSKMVWNFSIRGEANMRVFETMACGAVPLIEEGNLEVPMLFDEDAHFFSYTENNLEQVLKEGLKDPRKLWDMRQRVLDAARQNTKRKQCADLFHFVRREFDIDKSARPVPGPNSIPNLFKLNVLGLGYHGTQVFEKLEPFFALHTGLEGETVPGILLQYYKDGLEKNNKSQMIASYLKNQLFDKGALPAHCESYYKSQLHIWDARWEAAIEEATRCLSELNLLEADQRTGDRKALYRFFIPPLRLGTATTNDLNQSYQIDRLSGNYSRVVALLKDTVLSFLAEAHLAVGSPDPALAAIRRMSAEKFYSVPVYLWEARVYQKKGDGIRLAVALSDLFYREPLQYDHWGFILSGCQSIDRMDLWKYYFEKFLQLTKIVYHQNTGLRESLLKYAPAPAKG